MINPYYEDKRSGIVIYHGDCRTILPQLGKFDLLLTDPPYGIGADNQKRILSRSKLAAARDYGQSDWDKETPSPETVQMVIASAGLAIVWGGNYFGLPAARGWLVWDKDNTGDFADCELAWTNLPMAVRKIKHRWNGMLQEDMANKEARMHPTQKPLRVISWCLTFASDAQTVIDPFMGSGTTLRACKDLGRKCVGIELSEKYCEIAARRLQQEVLL